MNFTSVQLPVRESHKRRQFALISFNLFGYSSVVRFLLEQFLWVVASNTSWMMTISNVPALPVTPRGFWHWQHFSKNFDQKTNLLSWNYCHSFCYLYSFSECSYEKGTAADTQIIENKWNRLSVAIKAMNLLCVTKRNIRLQDRRSIQQSHKSTVRSSI